MIVRELVTQLSFAVDQSAVRRFDQVVGKMKTGLESMTRNLNQVGQNLQNVGLKTSLFLSAPIVAAGVAAVKVASDFEQLEVSFTTMLGSAEKANSLIRDMFQFAAKTPFEIKNIGPVTKQLLAVGIEQEKIIDTLKALGDISAGLGVPLQRLALNYGQVRTQGKLTGRELRDFAVAGVPLVEELTKVTGKQREEVLKMISAGEVTFDIVEQAFKNMTQEGGRFANLMQKQSQTLGGLFSNLKDNIFLTAGEFGKIIIETLNLKKVIESFSKSMDRLLKTFKGLTPFMQKFLIFMSLFLVAIGPVLLILGTMIKVFTFLHTSLMILKVAFFGAAGAAGTFNAAVLVIPALILAAIAVIALLIDDIRVWAAGGDSVIGRILGPWEDFKVKIIRIFTAVKNALQTFLIKPFMTVARIVMIPIKAILKAFAFLLNEFYAWLKGWNSAFDLFIIPFDDLKKAVKEAFDFLTDVFMDFINGPVKLLIDTLAKIGGVAGKILEKVFGISFDNINAGIDNAKKAALKGLDPLLEAKRQREAAGQKDLTEVITEKIFNIPLPFRKKKGRELEAPSEKISEEITRTTVEKERQITIEKKREEIQREPIIQPSPFVAMKEPDVGLTPLPTVKEEPTMEPKTIIVEKEMPTLPLDQIRPTDINLDEARQQQIVSPVREKAVTNNRVQQSISINNNNNITFNDASEITEEQAKNVADNFSQRFDERLQTTLDNAVFANPVLE